MTDGWLYLLALFLSLVLLGLGQLYLLGCSLFVSAALAVVEPRKGLCMAVWLLGLSLVYLKRWEMLVFGAMLSAAYIAAIVFMRER